MLELDKLKTLIETSNQYSGMELKQFVLDNNLHKIFGKTRRVHNLVIEGQEPSNMDVETMRLYCNIYSSILEYNSLAKCCENLNRNRQARTKRLNDKLDKMTYLGQCIFVTLTFNDKSLQNTTEVTRRRYVSRYLKEQSDYYIANIDYGEKNGREHYHAVVFGHLDLEKWHKYGGIDVERIKSGLNDNLKVSKYISKLTNHAIKNTCKNKRLIYSKKMLELNLKVRAHKYAEQDETFKIGLELFGDDLLHLN